MFPKLSIFPTTLSKFWAETLIWLRFLLFFVVGEEMESTSCVVECIGVPNYGNSLVVGFPVPLLLLGFTRR